VVPERGQPSTRIGRSCLGPGVALSVMGGSLP
jgi:hypothetical protein